ncbi:MAG: esterase-like activity of phytase family protein [Succinivibrio sp.]
MKTKLLLALAVSSVFSAQTLAVQTHVIPVDVPKDMYVNYPGTNPEFKDGFITGFGSSLAFVSQDPDGSLYFYGLTDRGPNADGPQMEYMSGDKTLVSPAKFFPAPDFVPSVGLIKVKDNKATVEKIIPLKDKDGNLISGRPLNIDRIGFTGEVAIDDQYRILPYDNNGLDSEGIAIAQNGNIFISDEYGPFLCEYNQDGVLLNKYAPTEGLPEIIRHRTPNRGSEGVAVMPDGSLALMVQSVLNLKNGEHSSKKTAHFARIVIFNPKDRSYRTVGYPINFDSYKKPGDAKLGDIYALNDHEFLIIEQGKDKNKVMQNYIYKVDIKGADNLNDAKKGGLEPEFFDDNGGFVMAKKELLVDLRKLGYRHEKAEGLTLLPDRKTIVVINDNDFGITVDVDDPANAKSKITDYTLKIDGTYQINGKTANPKFRFSRLDEKDSVSELFMVTLDSAL